jgi:hypothetical protein
MPAKFRRSRAPAVPDNVVSRLATIAHIPETSRNQFGELLRRAVALAHQTNEIHLSPHGRASDVTKFLRRVKTTAQHLDIVIAMLQGKGVGADQHLAAATAGVLLDQAIHEAVWDGRNTSKLPSWKTVYQQSNALPWSTQCRHLLALLITLTSKAEQRAADLFPKRRGRPKGTGGNPTFDAFVKDLLDAARKSGGRLPLGRDAYANKPAWKGTLLQAMKILRLHLPKDRFFPAGNIGYALERLSKEFRADTAKIRSAS